MNKKIITIILVIITISAVMGGVFWYSQNNKKNEVDAEIPYYFIAIHNEPLPDLNKHTMPNLEESYATLKRIIAKADEYNIKLTLMFTAQWADYINSSTARQADLESWKKSGHEIAAHHHNVSHGLWDGYTNLSKEEALKIRSGRGKNEAYLGTLTDYMNKLSSINSAIKSGCMSITKEDGSADIARQIIYSSCSDYANFGAIGTKLAETEPEKGINDYLTITNTGGTTKYLTNAQVTNKKAEKSAEQIFSSMTSGVYGAVAHSIENNTATGNSEEAQTIIDFMTFIHSKDPSGANSRTVSEVIEQKLLPEKTISNNLLKEKLPTQQTGAGKCGDGVCGPVEKANSALCPQDCK